MAVEGPVLAPVTPAENVMIFPFCGNMYIQCITCTLIHCMCMSTYCNLCIIMCDVCINICTNML